MQAFQGTLHTQTLTGTKLHCESCEKKPQLLLKTRGSACWAAPTSGGWVVLILHCQFDWNWNHLEDASEEKTRPESGLNKEEKGSASILSAP